MSLTLNYAIALVQKTGKSFESAEFFAKVLSPNDDSGKHGVLIPTDAYSFFPNLPIPDPTVNVTSELHVFNSDSGVPLRLSYKYYQRYLE